MAHKLFLMVLLALFQVVLYGETEPNDTMQQANNLPYNGTQSGSLSENDSEDWFVIQIPKGGIFTLTFHKTGPGNGNLYLYDGEKPGFPEIKNIYLSNDNSPASGWTLTVPLLSGKYYAKVLKSSGISNYQIDASLVLPFYTEDVEPNDSVAKASMLPVNGSMSGNVHYYAAAKGVDAIDWYKVDVAQGGILNMIIKKKGPGNTWLRFRDGKKTGFPEISNYYIGNGESVGDDWKWSYPVLSGVYYFQVEGGEGVVDYKVDLSLAVPAFAEDLEPNDTITKAVTMPVNGSVSGNVHYYVDGKGTDLHDWYKIEIVQGGILNFVINKKGPGNTWLHFRDSKKAGLPEISNYYLGYGESTGDDWKWSYPVLAGIYYFQVEGGGGVVDYKLNISLAVPGYAEDLEPNDTITKAITTPLNGSVSGNLHYYTLGKAADIEDWYKIEIVRGGILNLKINKKGPGNTWLHFRDPKKTGLHEISNFYLGYGENTGEDWKWSYPVLAGTYYIQMEGGGGVVDYKLETKFDMPVWGEDIESNDSLKFAQKFGLNDSIVGILAYYKSGQGSDNWDWYVMNTPEYGHLAFIVDKESNNNGNIHLRDTISEIASQYLGFGDQKVSFGKLVPACKYYLGFEKYSGDYRYKVKMKFTPVPKADFAFTPADNAIAFENKTLYGETYEWNFDDGKTEVKVNPYHEYLNPGNYDVCLIAKNISGADTICQRIVIPGLTRSYPNQAGNSGDATILVYGGGLDTLFHIRLEQNGVTMVSSNCTGFGGKSGISTTFDLRDKAIGLYDIVVEKKGGPVYKIPNGFQITQGKKAEPWAKLEGRNRILLNTKTTYRISYGNNGNVDATGVPIWIAISDVPNLTVEFTGMTIKIPDYVKERNLMDAYNSVDLFIRTDSILGQAFKSKVYAFYIPVIPAGTSDQITLKIKTSENVKVMVWVNDPYYESPMKGSLAACIASVFAEGVIDATAGALPGYTCIYQGLKSVYTLYSPFPGQPEQGNSWMSWFKSAAVSLVDCGISLTGVGNVVKVMGILFTNSYLYKEKLDDCKKAFPIKNKDDQDIAAVGSLDPNEKAGPSGFGTENYISSTRNMPYIVYFENKASATAPAHTIAITDHLDTAKFDISSFSFGNIFIGDSIVLVKPGLKEFVVDKKMDKQNIIARFSGKLDTLTGNVEWILRSLDPITFDDIEDPDIGLLPPNVTSPQGQGSVSFFIKMKTNPEHKTNVTNQASIVFDANPPILTNKHLTTFDLAAPKSAIQPLSATTNTKQFELKWSGSDDGSGIQGYNIYVKTNDGPYSLWKSGITETSAIFQSAGSNLYQFYSEAIDHVGNTELISGQPDAVTNVITGKEDGTLSETYLQVYPVPANDKLFVSIGVSGSFAFRIVGSDGRLILEKTVEGNGLNSIDIGYLQNGLYLWQLRNETSSVIKTGKFSVQK